MFLITLEEKNQALYDTRRKREDFSGKNAGKVVFLLFGRNWQMQKLPMTKRGAERLQKELNNLKNVERPAIIAAIAEAREHGDLSENAEYHAAREKQSFIEGRIQELEYAVSCAEVIDTSLLKNDAIVFGATVVLMNEDTKEEKTYQIVGQYEADLDRGLISVLSPMARALIGKSEGDDVQIASKSYEILEVKYV